MKEVREAFRLLSEIWSGLSLYERTWITMGSLLYLLLSGGMILCFTLLLERMREDIGVVFVLELTIGCVLLFMPPLNGFALSHRRLRSPFAPSHFQWLWYVLLWFWCMFAIALVIVLCQLAHDLSMDVLAMAHLCGECKVK